MKRIFCNLTIVAMLLLACGGEKDKQPRITHRPQPAIPEDPFAANETLPSADDSLEFVVTGNLAKQASELFKEISDAQARDYRWHNFVGLAETGYSFEGDSIKARVEQFLSREDAYGFYSLGRPQPARMLNLGVESYAIDNRIVFTSGEYVVTLEGGSEVTNNSSAATQLAREILTLINKPAVMSPYYIMFRTQDRIFPSDRYYAYDYLDINGLDKVFTTDYAKGIDTITMFLTMDEEGDKYIRLKEYALSIGKIDNVIRRFEFEQQTGLAFEHPELGTIVAGLVRSKLVGVVNYNPDKVEHFATGWVKGLK